jgi:hypothetical protein
MVYRNNLVEGQVAFVSGGDGICRPIAVEEALRIMKCRNEAAHRQLQIGAPYQLDSNGVIYVGEERVFAKGCRLNFAARTESRDHTPTAVRETELDCHNIVINGNQITIIDAEELFASRSELNDAGTRQEKIRLRTILDKLQEAGL